MSAITVNWTIDFGTIVQIVATAVTVTGGAFWLGHRLTRMEMKINIMWSWFTRRMRLDDTDEDIQRFFERNPTEQRRNVNMKTVIISGILAFSTIAWAQDAPKTAPTPPAVDTAKELRECREQNGTVVQLWRDISSQRGAYEVQMASIRAILGATCPETTPVSQCVASLAAKAASADAKPAAKPAAEPKK